MLVTVQNKMATHRFMHQSRRNRKLPNIGKQSSSTSSFFWLSFQSALQWIRKNEETITRFSQLLQFYPNLIQDNSLDGFWEFLEPLLKEQNESECPMDLIRGRPSFNPLHYVSTKTASDKGLPTISVTKTKEYTATMPFIPSKKARTPRVHLINHGNDSSVTKSTGTLSLKGFPNKTRPSDQDLFELLQEHFYIRRAFPPARHDGQNSNNGISRLYVLSESDVCLFLFNDFTVKDADSFHDLCTALALKIPVLFIRHYNQELPKTFAESIQHLSRGCLSLNDYIEKFVFGNHEHRKGAAENRKPIRPNPAALRAIRTRSSSTSDLNVKGIKIRKDRGKMSNATGPDTDLLLYMINSFQTAHIFDENNIAECSRQLRLGIYKVIGITYAEDSTVSSFNKQHFQTSSGTGQENADINSNIESQSTFERKDFGGNRSNCLSVPEADNLLLTREWSNSGCTSAPPRADPAQDGRFTYHIRSASPASLEQQSTTYLIFDDQTSSKKVRKISFPLDLDLDENDVTENCCDMDSDEYDPGGSPIHFPDIDLGREINTTIENPEIE